jgi:hypothetical protein
MSRALQITRAVRQTQGGNRRLPARREAVYLGLNGWLPLAGCGICAGGRLYGFQNVRRGANGEARSKTVGVNLEQLAELPTRGGETGKEGNCVRFKENMGVAELTLSAVDVDRLRPPRAEDGT